MTVNENLKMTTDCIVQIYRDDCELDIKPDKSFSHYQTVDHGKGTISNC